MARSMYKIIPAQYGLLTERGQGQPEADVTYVYIVVTPSDTLYAGTNH